MNTQQKFQQFSDKLPMTEEQIADLKATAPVYTPVYTTSQAANFFSVSIRTIQDWITRGYFPNAYALNPKTKRPTYRIPRSDIARIIELRRRQQVITTAGNSTNPS